MSDDAEVLLPGTSLVVVSSANGGPIPAEFLQQTARRSLRQRLAYADRVIDGEELEDHATLLGVIQMQPKVRDKLKALDLLVKVANVGEPELNTARLTVNVFGGIGLGAPTDGLGSPERVATGLPGPANAIVEGLGLAE